MKAGFWEGRSVFLTGHTGFKGAWLALVLQQAGARVHGFSTMAPTRPDLFSVARVERGLVGHTVGDVRDAVALRAALVAAEPEVIIHLAAQSLVRESYRDPLETFVVNVVGTATLLDAARHATTVRAVLNVTSDKCYENREGDGPHRETDALGGHDPYSSSKACAELVTSAYRDSFLAAQGVAVATARAGNVIGGGDWAADRLVPDFFRAVDAGRRLEVRHPEAIRPWQHVLDPLAGYLLLAQQLVEQGPRAAGAWNFGPVAGDARAVRWVLDRLCQGRPSARWERSRGNHPREAATLLLDSSRARSELDWQPRWGLEEALERTLVWHDAWKRGDDMHAHCLGEIESHREPIVA